MGLRVATAERTGIYKRALMPDPNRMLATTPTPTPRKTSCGQVWASATSDAGWQHKQHRPAPIPRTSCVTFRLARLKERRHSCWEASSRRSAELMCSGSSPNSLGERTLKAAHQGRLANAHSVGIGKRVVSRTILFRRFLKLDKHLGANTQCRILASSKHFLFPDKHLDLILTLDEI